MTEVGDIYLADLRGEQRRRVAVLSTEQFSRSTGRALVAPEMPPESEVGPNPWRTEYETTTFAIDFVRTVPVALLLERVDRLPRQAVESARRALRHVT